MSETAMRRRTLGLSGGLIARATNAGLVVWFVVGALVVFSIMGSDAFLSPRNLGNAMGQMVVLGLLAIGQTFVILVGAVDLSFGSMVNLSAVLTAGLIDGDPSRVVPMVSGVLPLGAATGYVNGWISTRLGITPIITTLGTLSVLEGLAFAYTTVRVRLEPAGARVDGLPGDRFGPLAAIIAVVVGGASLLVGRGRVLGSIGGAALITLRQQPEPARDFVLLEGSGPGDGNCRCCSDLHQEGLGRWT